MTPNDPILSELLRSTFDWLESRIPWFAFFLLALALIVVMVYVVYGFIRARQASKGSLLWGMITWENPASVDWFQEQIKELNDDANRKENFIYVTNLFVRELTDSLFLFSADGQTGNGDFMDILVSNVSSILSDQSHHRVLVLVPDGEHLIPRAWANFSSSSAAHLKLPIHGTIAGKAYVTGKPCIRDDVTKDSDFYRLPSATTEFRSLVCLPVTAYLDGRRSVLGVLSVDAVKPKAFRDEDVTLLRYLTTYLAIALQGEQIVKYCTQQTADVVAGGELP